MALSAQDILAESHYLGRRGGLVYRDPDGGVLVFGNPTSRMLPHPEWIELKRWCITDGVANAGSGQWSRAWRWLYGQHAATTVVSYSDPAAGHDGALYRASGWLWAPTWHRLREPPTGSGNRSGKRHSVKDRWVFLLRPDPGREHVLALKDSALESRYPWAQYVEPRWRKGRPRQEGGGDFSQWRNNGGGRS